jgi:hypothetical protein
LGRTEDEDYFEDVVVTYFRYAYNPPPHFEAKAGSDRYTLMEINPS